MTARRPSRATQILLADLARAIRTLRPADQETDRAVAVALGLSVRSDREAPLAEATAGATPTAAVPVAPSTAQRRGRAGPEVEELSEPRPLRAQLERLEASTVEPAWLTDVAPLPAAPPRPAASVPPPSPLFLPRWTPGILAAAVATVTGEGEIDVSRAVETVAAGEPLLTLPRFLRPTLRHGAQVLVDVGAGMLPFARDEADLWARLERMVGSDEFELLRFRGCPDRGAGSGLRPTWAAGYEPPPRARPVVLLTDLGIGSPPLADDPAPVDEWLGFVATVRQAGCPIVAFVPYPPARVPRALARTLPVVYWDRGTTAAGVRSVVGAGLEARR